jgi:hypothetical protein
VLGRLWHIGDEMINLFDRISSSTTVEDLENLATEILESWHSLLYLMGEGAATPDQVRTFVEAAAKALGTADGSQIPYYIH